MSEQNDKECVTATKGPTLPTDFTEPLMIDENKKLFGIDKRRKPAIGQKPIVATNIIDAYSDLIDFGYKMTYQDIADYLSIERGYVQKFAAEFWRIAVNRELYIIFRKENRDDGEYEEYLPLLRNRRLLLEQEVHDVLLHEMRVAYSYVRVSVKATLEDMEHWRHSELRFVKRLDREEFVKIVTAHIPSFFINVKPEPIEKTLDELPSKLWSMQDIVKENSYRSTPMGYNLVKKYAIPKIKFRNLVRYSVEHYKEAMEADFSFSVPRQCEEEAKERIRMSWRKYVRDCQYDLETLDMYLGIGKW